MALTADQQRVKSLLAETVTLLCKNGLHFDSEFTIEGLIGITIDRQDVFLVSIKETVGLNGQPTSLSFDNGCVNPAHGAYTKPVGGHKRRRKIDPSSFNTKKTSRINSGMVNVSEESWSQQAQKLSSNTAVLNTDSASNADECGITAARTVQGSVNFDPQRNIGMHWNNQTQQIDANSCNPDFVGGDTGAGDSRHVASNRSVYESSTITSDKDHCHFDGQINRGDRETSTLHQNVLVGGNTEHFGKQSHLQNQDGGSSFAAANVIEVKDELQSGDEILESSELADSFMNYNAMYDPQSDNNGDPRSRSWSDGTIEGKTNSGGQTATRRQRLPSQTSASCTLDTTSISGSALKYDEYATSAPSSLRREISSATSIRQSVDYHPQQRQHGSRIHASFIVHAGEAQRYQTHTFVCPKCSKIFGSRKGFQLHQQLHDGIYRYTCTECGKGCSGTTQLRGHMASHTLIKEFVCPVCKLEYGYKKTLIDHMKRLHGRDLNIDDAIA